METERLIQTLVATAAPVRPLPHPWFRSVLWLAIAIPYMALIVYVMSPRADLLVKLFDTRYLIEQFAALATGISAAIAAFATTIPGYSRKVLLLPAPPLAVWLGSLGQGCISTLLQFGPSGLTLQSDWFCLPAIMLIGAIPAVAMVVMLRRGAPLIPCTTITLGALAAAGLGNFGLRLFHPQDASLMVLIWQFGSVFILTAVSGCMGRFVLNWRSVIVAGSKLVPIQRPNS
jgi:hypothetical protein